MLYSPSLCFLTFAAFLFSAEARPVLEDALSDQGRQFLSIPGQKLLPVSTTSLQGSPYTSGELTFPTGNTFNSRRQPSQDGSPSLDYFSYKLRASEGPTSPAESKLDGQSLLLQPFTPGSGFFNDELSTPGGPASPAESKLDGQSLLLQPFTPGSGFFNDELSTPGGPASPAESKLNGQSLLLQPFTPGYGSPTSSDCSGASPPEDLYDEVTGEPMQPYVDRASYKRFKAEGGVYVGNSLGLDRRGDCVLLSHDNLDSVGQSQVVPLQKRKHAF
ncbi:hypothetical protein IWQ60_005264 [Tieghemiomyces parasiticus]|uniref:Uncharacterized protein n=1 Tax=Tieghemiomyces parasiticus TaxID=78921 RepID=A0A9W8AED5_9FUNG|nr:hypothetical protein IWQ60_005264 [Tieghemiomyces parasiticus]